MDKFKCQITNLSRDFASGQAVVTMTAEPSVLPALEQICKKDLNCKLTKFSKSRSLDSNAYLWVLISKLQAELSKNDPHITKDEIYVNYIRQYGRSIEYQIPNDAVNAMTAVWGAYGLGWFAEKIDEGSAENTSIIRFYYGSSCYSQKRMTRLIEAVVTDCKALDIETLTPDEIAELNARWGDKNG